MRPSQMRTARAKLEGAVASLLNKAAAYSGIPGSFYDTTNLLEAAREYARALRRIETMRRK